MDKALVERKQHIQDSIHRLIKVILAVKDDKYLNFVFTRDFWDVYIAISYLEPVTLQNIWFDYPQITELNYVKTDEGMRLACVLSDGTEKYFADLLKKPSKAFILNILYELMFKYNK